MSETRNAYLGQIINLELYTSDYSGTIASVDSVLIMLDKEICYIPTAILHPSPSTWQITVDTSTMSYEGTFTDRWIINGSIIVEKHFTLTQLATASVEKVSTDYYYSKDLLWEAKPNGDLYRIYDSAAIDAKIKAVCGTVKGSLFFEPTYGASLLAMLFLPNVVELKDTIATDLQMQLSTQVPQIEIKQVIVEDISSSYIAVDVQFYVINSMLPAELLSTRTVVSLDQIGI